jgi:hypothetical protein
MMPKMDGFEVVREIRKDLIFRNNDNCKGEDFERIMGLDIGQMTILLNLFPSGGYGKSQSSFKKAIQGNYKAEEISSSD